MGFVHDQGCPRSPAERRVLAERGEVAVHAEERFHDDKTVTGCRRHLRKKLRKTPNIIMRKDDAGRCGEPDPVDQAGVISLIGKHHVFPLGDRRRHADVREITAGKVQRALRPLEFGEPPLDRGEDIAVAAKQPRPGAAASLAPDGAGEPIDDDRMR